MKKILLLIGMCIILSSFSYAIMCTGGTLTNFTNATGTYYVHTFLSNSSLICSQAGTATTLVVGGGGGGGSMSGGGGGGGVIYNESITLSATTYNIVVGTGGNRTLNATNSWLGTLVNASFGGAGALGGGGAGVAYTGGSGGGGGSTTANLVGAAGTAGQGYNGGNASSQSGSYSSAGGGGCGGSGANVASASANGGNGGTGCSYSINGSSVCYAGGGGGHAGSTYSAGTGSCGGGNGSTASTVDGKVAVAGSHGTNGTGGGGGGGGTVVGVQSLTGYSGGNGIVIVAYQYNIPNLVYPNITVHYNEDDYNGSIILNSSQNMTCTINDSRWTKTSTATNTTLTWINNTVITDGNYSMSTNCSDISNLTFWFVIDKTHPQIYQYYPSSSNTTRLNLSTSATATLQLNITTNDTYLYQANLTIYNSTGSVWYNNYSGILSGVNGYVWNSSITNLTPDRYTIIAEATDSHTDKEITSFSPKIDKVSTYKNINYKSPKEWGGIEFKIELLSSSLEFDDMIDIKTKDRHSPKFKFKDNGKGKVNTYIFMITSSRPLVYLPKSNYIGHFVSTDGMRGVWYDSMFDGYEGSQFNINKIDDYSYTIEIKTLKNDLKFNSLGGLNYNSLNSTFEVLNNVSIWAVNSFTGAYITNFSVLVNSTVYNTSTNTTTLYLLTNRSYTLNISKPSYNTSVITHIISFTNETIIFNMTESSALIKFYDENTNLIMNTTNISFTIIKNSTIENYTVTNGTLYLPLSIGDYTCYYSVSNYSTRTGTFSIASVSITNVSLYIVLGSNIQAYVYDEYGVGLENYNLETYRLIGSGWTKIDSGYTNSEGLVGFIGLYNTPYYYWKIKNSNGTLVKVSEITQIYASPLTFFVPLGETINQEYNDYMKLSSVLIFDNVTNMFNYSFNDPTSTATSFLLNVYKNNTLIATNSTTITIGKLTLNMSGIYTNDTVYTAKTYVNYGYGYTIDQTLTHYYPATQRDNSWYKVGLFLTGFVVIVFSIMGAYYGGVSGAFIMTGVGLMFSFMLKLNLIEKTTITIIIACCFIGAFLTREK